MNTNFEKHQKEAQEFLEQIAAEVPALPYEPTLIPMLFAAMREGSSISIDGISGLVAKSPTLASKVLSIANSALYAPPEPIVSLPRAISLLGFSELRALLVTVGAVSVLNKMHLPHKFNGHALWQHQVRTAFIARSLVSALHDPVITLLPVNIHPDEIYSAALIHDIGTVFFAALRPKVWMALSTESLDQNAMAQREQEYWGIDHGIIGAVVLKAWGLPELLYDIVAHHHSPSQSEKLSLHSSLLCAADLIAHNPPGMDDIQLSPEITALLPPLRNSTLLTVLMVEACASSGAESLVSSIL